MCIQRVTAELFRRIEHATEQDLHDHGMMQQRHTRKPPRLLRPQVVEVNPRVQSLQFDDIRRGRDVPSDRRREHVPDDRGRHKRHVVRLTTIPFATRFDKTPGHLARQSILAGRLQVLIHPPEPARPRLSLPFPVRGEPRQHLPHVQIAKHTGQCRSLDKAV